jgi:hypothetical protein
MAAKLTNEQAVGSAKMAKDMALRSIDDAICIVALRGRDGVLPPATVQEYVTHRIDAARAELDRLQQALLGGV